MSKYCLYVHINKINGKQYVGVTKQVPRSRWNNGYGYESQDKFYRAIKKYGWDNFEHLILCENKTREEIELLEIEEIKKRDSIRNGYNISVGGWVTNHSEETKNKISNLRKGMKFSEETRHKLSVSHKGIHPTEAQNIKNMMNNPKRKEVICIETGIKYPSLRDAVRKTKITTIGAACNKMQKTAGGKHWVYSEDYTEEYAYEVLNLNKDACNGGKRVVCLETGKVYGSIISACRELNISETSVRKSLFYQNNELKGVTIRYYDEK